MHVRVLISTYNGQEWLPEQLDSILDQDHSDLTVVVRDDGSSDRTCAVLEQYARVDRRLTWSAGSNMGAGASFLRLLRDARVPGAATAFADQDDVWDRDHLRRAVDALEAMGPAPALWTSRVLACDASLTPLRPHGPARAEPSFENALVENLATGCSSVLNAAASELVASTSPGDVVMHDAWCYLVVAAFGSVRRDPRPSVRYRLHGRNTVGLASGPVTRLLSRLSRAQDRTASHRWTRQAAELRTLYAEALPPCRVRELDRFCDVSVRGRASYLVHGSARRQSPAGTVAVRLLHAMGRV